MSEVSKNNSAAYKVDSDKYAENYERIFGTPNLKKTENENIQEDSE